MRAADLTPKEQGHVRAALQFLHSRSGPWAPLAKMLGISECGASVIASGLRPVSPAVAFRIARLVKVPIDDLLEGRFPAPGTCPRGGHREEAQP